jgi:hypothetical protein
MGRNFGWASATQLQILLFENILFIDDPLCASAVHFAARSVSMLFVALQPIHSIAEQPESLTAEMPNSLATSSSEWCLMDYGLWHYPASCSGL